MSFFRDLFSIPAARDLIVRVRPDTVRTFRCNSYVDTLRDAYIASQMLVAARSART